MAFRDITNTANANVAARPLLSRPPKLGASGPAALSSSHVKPLTTIASSSARRGSASKCDRCDGLHATDVCPNSMKAREDHKAATASAAFISRSGSGELAFHKGSSNLCGDSSTASTRATSSATPLLFEELLPEDRATDPQEVAEYVPDIYSNLLREESLHLPRPEYMDSQPDINPRFRATLIDWLVEVQLKHRLKTETLFLAVNIIDRYLGKRRISRTKLQLVGVTSMLIAAKYEEIYPPEIRDIVYICDNVYTRQEFLTMETSILGALEFNIAVPTSAHFFERYQRVNNCCEQHRHLLQYVLELCLPEFGMIRYSPSHITAAATYLTNKLMKQHPSWPPQMVSCSRHTEQMMKACAKEMCGILEAAERNPLEAIKRKFSHAKYLAVAKMTF